MDVDNKGSNWGGRIDLQWCIAFNSMFTYHVLLRYWSHWSYIQVDIYSNWCPWITEILGISMVITVNIYGKPPKTNNHDFIKHWKLGLLRKLGEAYRLTIWIGSDILQCLWEKLMFNILTQTRYLTLNELIRGVQWMILIKPSREFVPVSSVEMDVCRN